MTCGNSIYFDIPKITYFHSVSGDIKDAHHILHISCQFNYSQPVNGKMMYISCNYGHKLLNDTKAPAQTVTYYSYSAYKIQNFLYTL